MILQIDVTNILSLPITNTTAGVSAGAAVSTNVVNTNNFAGNDYVVVGNLGDEGSELQLISSITDADTMVIGSLSLAHPSGTPVQKSNYNQLVIERSTDNSSWSTVTTQTIRGDQKTIEYNDTSGTAASYYRFRFYNSTTTTYSGYSTSFSQSDAPSAQDIIITEVIRELGTEYDDTVTKDVIFSALADTDLKVAREITKTNKEFYKSSIEINMVSGTTEYALPANLVSITEVQLGYETSANKSKSSAISVEYGFNDEDLGHYYHSVYRKASDGLTYLILRNSPRQNVTGGITVTYVTKPVRITSTTSQLLTPQPMLYIDLLKNGIKEIIYRDYKEDLQRSAIFGTEFRVQLRDLLAITNTFDFTPGANLISDGLAYAFSTP
jgi:hypothetical protein